MSAELHNVSVKACLKLMKYTFRRVSYGTNSIAVHVTPILVLLFAEVRIM
jgi:hypothetical protein